MLAEDGTKSFQVYERARFREKSIKVYVGSFSSRREAEFAAQQHRAGKYVLDARAIAPHAMFVLIAFVADPRTAILDQRRNVLLSCGEEEDVIRCSEARRGPSGGRSTECPGSSRFRTARRPRRNRSEAR